MQTVTLHIGGPDRIFPVPTTLTEPFSLAAPATTAAALLQVMDLRYPEGDNDFGAIQVQTVARFVAGQSSGFVEVRFVLEGGDVRHGPIGAELEILVVAV